MYGVCILFYALSHKKQEQAISIYNYTTYFFAVACIYHLRLKEWQWIGLVNTSINVFSAPTKTYGQRIIRLENLFDWIRALSHTRPCRTIHPYILYSCAYKYIDYPWHNCIYTDRYLATLLSALSTVNVHSSEQLSLRTNKDTDDCNRTEKHMGNKYYQ